MTEKIRILIVEDYKLMRISIKSMLEIDPTLDVVAEAENGLEAIEKAKQFRPDIILMDIRMPVMNGADATRKIKEFLPDTKVIMLTCCSFGPEVQDALESGLDGYFVKDSPTDVLIKVIKSVKEGAFWTDPAISAIVKSRVTQKSSTTDIATPSYSHLTEREHDVLKMLAAGKSNHDIADIMKISEHTTKMHVQNIIHKLVVEDLAHAVLKAKREGLV